MWADENAPLLMQGTRYHHPQKAKPFTFWSLYILLGWCGAHRLQLGHARVAMLMFLSFGFGFCGWVSDALLMSRYIDEARQQTTYVVCAVASSVRIFKKTDDELAIGFPPYMANVLMYLFCLCGLSMVGFSPTVWAFLKDNQVVIMASLLYIWLVTTAWARLVWKISQRITHSAGRKNAYIVGSVVLYAIWMFGVYHDEARFSKTLRLSLMMQGAIVVGLLFVWNILGMTFTTELVNFRFLKVDSPGKICQTKLVVIKQATSLNMFASSHTRVREYPLTKDFSIHLITEVKHKGKSYDFDDTVVSYKAYASTNPSENLLSSDTEEHHCLATSNQWAMVCHWIGCEFLQEKMFVPVTYVNDETTLDVVNVKREAEAGKKIRAEHNHRLQQEIRSFQDPAKIRQVFNRIDLNGGGTIDKGELRAMMQRFGFSLNDAEIGELWKLIDTDFDGVVSLPEFSQYFIRHAHHKRGALMDMFPLLVFDEEVQYSGSKQAVNYSTVADELMPFPIKFEQAAHALLNFYPYGRRYVDLESAIQKLGSNVVWYLIREKDVEDSEDQDVYCVWGVWDHGDLYALAYHSTSSAPVAQIISHKAQILNVRMLDDPVSFHKTLNNVIEDKTFW